MARRPRKRSIEVLTHDEESRKNIPTAELESVMSEGDKTPLRVAYERRNRDLDPQLVWRGKDDQDEADLVVQAPPLYIQEKIHPKVLIDDLTRESRARAQEQEDEVPDLFADFNGLPNLEASTEFYQHDQNWSNRMILGDSLQVMASLAEREGLRGEVQCIYIDPPYGIRFNSNFQWSTTSRDVRDGKKEHITREPEQVRAYRDTWRDGIHSYLSYLRSRFLVARDLLKRSGSVFVQIGEENCHLVRSLLDEVFGSENFVSQVVFSKTASATSEFLSGTYDVLLFYAKERRLLKYRQPLQVKSIGGLGGSAYKRVRLQNLSERKITTEETLNPSRLPEGSSVFRIDNLTSQSVGRAKGEGAASWFPVELDGRTYRPSERVRWKTNREGMERLRKAGRLAATETGLYYVRHFTDFRAYQEDNIWSDTGIAGFTSEKRYVVETSAKVVQRCLTMATDPGDLVLDPTCGSGTTAYVAEQWGRRWIVIDTSRVALALARSRIMSARFPWYLLKDSPQGQLKEAEITRSAPSSGRTYGDIRRGFVCERIPHITLKSIVGNAEIDIIHSHRQEEVESALTSLNQALQGHPRPYRITAGRRRGTMVQFGNKGESEVVPSDSRHFPPDTLAEWEVPHMAPDDWPAAASEPLARFWQAKISKQRAMDASIAAHADFEYLHDNPYEDRDIVRVAGPFTVESLTPHRVVEAELTPSEKPSNVGEAREASGDYATGSVDEPSYDFRAAILDQLRAAGVQQTERLSKIDFTSLVGWPGGYVCAEGRYLEGDSERRAGILIGPEHGTVGRGDLMAAAREAGEAGFDLLISCAFNYDAQSTDVNKLGRLPILKARMNADLQMSTDLKTTRTGNLFVVFGEPDIEVRELDGDQIQVKINGVDLFDPQTGDVRSSEAQDLACWFIDTDYDMASFFVRHAYFLGANDPYKALKTTLKTEIDADAWQSLRADTSRPFERPSSGRIAVKAINHLGDEVMKVLDVP